MATGSSHSLNLRDLAECEVARRARWHQVTPVEEGVPLPPGPMELRIRFGVSFGRS